MNQYRESMLHIPFVKKIIKELLIRIHLIPDNTTDYYISKISKTAPWAYVSYIADVFYHTADEIYLNVHQNRREAIEIVKIFNKLGYNVYVQDFCSNRTFPPIENVKVVFGLEPLFERACDYYAPQFRIYYATGAYWKHQNQQIRKITDLFNKAYNVNIPYRRLVSEHYSCEKAYCILQIGSKYTLETYPAPIRRKIKLIHQSSQEVFTNNVLEYSEQNEFMFLGSAGNLLKGVSLIIEYFSSHSDKVINIVGPLEDDVKDALGNKISNNIRLLGFVDVCTEEFNSIAMRCNFLIYPSGSEGCPGSVLTAMKHGIIPIVSKWSAFDEIADYGFIMDSWSQEGIDAGIVWSSSLSREQISERKIKCRKLVDEKFTLSVFSNDCFNHLANITHP